MTELSESRMQPIDFLDAGAGDDEPVKGICQGHIRQWNDEFVDAYGLIKTLINDCRTAHFRWLIEAPGARYLAVRRLSMSDNFEWTVDHDKALAFRSKEQADALMMAVRQIDGSLFAFETTLGNAIPVEHGWVEQHIIEMPAKRTTPDPTRFSTAWEREDYERRKRGESELGPGLC